MRTGQGRRYTIALDSDITDNEQIRHAAGTLGAADMEKNAVRLVVVPNVLSKGKKTVIDDYSKKEGIREVKKMFDQAATISGPVELESLIGGGTDMEPIEYLWEPYIPKGDDAGG